MSALWYLGGMLAGAAAGYPLGVHFGLEKKITQAYIEKRESILFRTLIMVVGVFAFVVVMTITWFLTKGWPSDPALAAVFGQRGDFFGGFVNPFLTFITFVGFLYTIRLQQQEIKREREQASKADLAAIEQREVARQQNYQAAFFQMLGSYNDIVNSIRVEDPVKGKAPAVGRAAFRVIYSALRKTYREKKKQFTSVRDEKVIRYSYGHIYKRYQFELGHYFRSLYNTLLLLEEGPDSKKYIKLFRAQISNQELLVLFYNCAVSPYGQNFIKLSEKHELFNNIPAHLLKESHANFLPSAVFGEGGYTAIISRRSEILGDMRDAPKAAQ